LIQSEKPDHKSLFGSFKKEQLSDLPDGKNPIGRLNNVAIEDLSKSKKLSAFQGVLK
jgi:hypothetical protein